jgi:hypothetical protein
LTLAGAGHIERLYALFAQPLAHFGRIRLAIKIDYEVRPAMLSGQAERQFRAAA